MMNESGIEEFLCYKRLYNINKINWKTFKYTLELKTISKHVIYS